jgi:radical SAM protein with 4Fe4S-binding SPASM domain
MAYGEFSKRLFANLGGRRLPLSGSLELTWRCNQRCVHCFLNLPAGDRRARQQELSLSQWRRLLDEIVAEGCLWLLLTGGEPLLRPDFLEIYTHAKRQGLLLTLFTNGALITPAIADHLAAWRPFVVEISVYGRTRETYEAVTGVSGSYDRCLQGIHLLLERQINLNLKTVVLTLNQHELADLKSWAADLGVPFRFDAVINPRVDDSRTPCAFRISPEKLVELDLQDRRRLAEWRDFLQLFQGRPDSDDLYQCGAGSEVFHVDPYGSLSACMLARQPAYDLSQGSFKEGWEDFLLKVRQQKRLSPNSCSSCELISLCEQCPGWSQLEHGDPEQPVDYLCRIARLRAAAFGLDVWS